MRFISMFFFLAFNSVLFGQGDYVIYINDTLFDLTLDEEYQLSVNDKFVKLRIEAKDTLSYNDLLYSFKYSKDYKVSRMFVEEGVEQIVIMIAEGSGILIQQHTNYNPTMLNEIMIGEVTKESINYGYKLKRKEYKRKLISGQTVQVDKAILTYKDEVNIYEVASIGGKDEGIVIMTIKLDDNTDSEGQRIIDMMWNTLIYK